MDATERSLAKFNDRAAWDEVLDDVPIFVPHDCYERQGKGPDGRAKTLYAVVPPGEKPRGSHAWRFSYAVDAAKIRRIAEGITRQWEDYGCPVKLFAGHTRSPGAVGQDAQPPLIGYGAFGAKVMPWGKKKLPAVFLRKQFISKGYGELARELPERSPEFYPDQEEIRAVALLKTDPRLSMGITLYQQPEGRLVCYGRGVDDMPDPTKMPPSAAEERDNPSPAPEGDDPEGDEEFKGRMKRLYAKCHAMQYGDEAAPMAAPSGTNGRLPGGKPDERDDFERQAHAMQYSRIEARVKEMEQREAQKECERVVKDLIAEGYFIKEPAKERDRLLRMDYAQREERVKEIRDNYQRDPATTDMIRTDYGSDNGAAASATDPALATEIVQYAESNKLDVNNDDDWQKAAAAVAKNRRRR